MKLISFVIHFSLVFYANYIFGQNYGQNKLTVHGCLSIVFPITYTQFDTLNVSAYKSECTKCEDSIAHNTAFKQLGLEGSAIGHLSLSYTG